MSLPTSSPSPSKKRKHEQHVQFEVPSPHKKSKKDGREKKSKGKSKADGQFQIVNASVRVSIPPKFFLNPLSGVLEMLDSLIMKYVPALQGVMLCHTNTQFVSNMASLKYECPFSICTVSFDATVWSPRIGMKLLGKINLCSPDHISLLVHRTFNVSIPREHIPTENWAFEHGPAENDPEFGPSAFATEEKNTIKEERMDIDGNTIPVPDSGEQDEPHGSWVHKVTGDKLGGEGGLLEFTVIGMTVANQMLSLKASLQPDPFSPLHVPQPAVPTTQLDVEGDDEEEKNETEKLLIQQHPDIANEDSEDEDPFAHLGRARDEAVQREEAETERAKEEKVRAKEEKKRRKRERKERKEKEKALGAVDGLTGTEEKPPKKKHKKSSQKE